MKALLHSVAAAVLTCVGSFAQAPMPVVSQAHVLSIHVPDHATFDSVFLLLRDVLQLPLVYGEMNKPADNGQRLYAGFSVGNAYLEPCGPYATDAPFTLEQRARFHGLTFSSGKSLAEAVKDLDDRTIAHSDIMGIGDTARFVYLSDALLTGTFQAVSLWEVQNKNDRVSFSFLRSALREAKGGALGVKRLAEVRVGYPNSANLARWRSFLTGWQHEGNVWFVGDGPALRLVPARESQIESIILQVESLEKAKAALSQMGLAGKPTSDGIELDSAKTLGLKIILKEK